MYNSESTTFMSVNDQGNVIITNFLWTLGFWNQSMTSIRSNTQKISSETVKLDVRDQIKVLNTVHTSITLNTRDVRLMKCPGGRTVLKNVQYG